MGENSSQLLLPGIPDDITVNNIIPKLLTLLSPVLSLVSTGWRKAIQSHEVYDARTRSHPTETFVVLNHKRRDNRNGLALYSTRDKSWYQLPPIPVFDCRFPWSCECIALDRKIYVIGGDGDYWAQPVGSGKAFVLDLAQSSLEWKRCADMQQPRKYFGCIVRDGKILVFGGKCPVTENPMCECEVYDPKENSWSFIPPMVTYGYGHHIASLGDELVVFGGCRYYAHGRLCHGLEFYHPGENQWRLGEPFGLDFQRLFMVQEKFYGVAFFGICVHDDDIGKWSCTKLQSFSHAAIEDGFLSEDSHWCPVKTVTGEKSVTISNWCPVLALNGELLTSVHCHNSVTHKCEVSLLQSKGFSSTNETIVWEKMDCSLSLNVYPSAPLLCPISL